MSLIDGDNLNQRLDGMMSMFLVSVLFWIILRLAHQFLKTHKSYLWSSLAIAILCAAFVYSTKNELYRSAKLGVDRSVAMAEKLKKIRYDFSIYQSTSKSNVSLPLEINEIEGRLHESALNEQEVFLLLATHPSVFLKEHAKKKYPN